MHIVDVFLIVLFLCGTLIAGLYHKSKSFKDFAVGDKTFTSFTQISTLVATYISGSSFFTVLYKVYNEGILYLFAILGSPLSLCLTAWIFVPKLEKALKYNSVAEMLGSIYDKSVRVFASIMGILMATGFIAAQFKIFGSIFGYFFDLDTRIVIVIAGIIVTIYASTGGIRSVTYTDIVQFITFALIIPLIGIFIWEDIFYNKIPINIGAKLNLKEILHFSNPDLWSVIFLFLYFGIPALDPTAFQRILIGKNISNIKRNFFFAGIIITFFLVLMSLIPLLLSSLSAEIKSQDLIGFIAEKYEYLGIKGLLIVGVCSMAMSSADSDLNSSSVLFGNDLLFLLRSSDSQRLFYTKMFSFILGGGAILLAISQKDILNIVLSGANYYMAVVTPVLFLVLFGFQTSKKIILTSMSLTFCFITFFMIKTSLNIGSKYLVSGMVVNTIIILFLHYFIKPKGLGWKITKTSPHTEKKNFFTKIQKSFQNTLSDKGDYFVLGIYAFIFALSSLYYQIDLFHTHKNIILPLYVVTFIFSIGLILLPYFFLNSLRKNIIFNMLSIFLIFFVLSFFNILLNLPSGFDNIRLALFSINILVLFFFLEWKIASFMIFIGLLSAIGFYNIFFQTAFGSLKIGSPLSVFLYLGSIFFILIFFIIPKKNRDKIMERKLFYTKNQLSQTKKRLTHLISEFNSIRDKEQNKSIQEQEILKLKQIKKEFFDTLESHTRSSIIGISSVAEALYDDLFYYGEEKDEEIKKQILQIITNSKNTLLNIENLIIHSEIGSGDYVFNDKNIIFSELVQKRIDICSVVYCPHFVENEDKQIFLNLKKEEKNMIITCDPVAIGYLLDNILVHVIISSKSFIKIDIQKVDLMSISIKFTFKESLETEKKFLDSLGYILTKEILKFQNGDISISKNLEEETNIVINLLQRSK